MLSEESVHELFGSFRAEYLREDIYRLFSEPAYFPHLVGDKSCVLEGGRGSGKTTVLRCLSFEGQRALGRFNSKEPAHVGIYYRVNTNVVTAFDGTDLPDLEWRRLFGHYFNLTVCSEFTSYLSSASKDGELDLATAKFISVGETLGIGPTPTLADLEMGIQTAIDRLEVYINNTGSERPTISQLQAPISRLLQVMQSLPGHQLTSFYIILDEYENLLDYQQMVVNTIIKHSGDNCYFKIGVRELGWRVRSTLNSNETLISPADYEAIRIEERLRENFADFAAHVCGARLENLSKNGGVRINSADLLQTLSSEDEAEMLGVSEKVGDFRTRLTRDETLGFDQSKLHDLELYVFYALNGESYPATVNDLASYYRGKPSAKTKFDNYVHAMLFSIAGKGSTHTKYYCGHKTFARLANTNIRFYMQLLHESVVEQLAANKTLNEKIGPKEQTAAAKRVGQSYLRELEGVTVHGGQLSRLILGFGRLFQILAANPIGTTPERNQFSIRESVGTSDAKMERQSSLLLREGIMHLALVRSRGTKLIAETDIRAWDYALHPIFSPFFTYSSRRKRKSEITDFDLVEMSRAPKLIIRKLLGDSRAHLADAELPTQMSLFDEFLN